MGHGPVREPPNIDPNSRALTLRTPTDGLPHLNIVETFQSPANQGLFKLAFM